LKRKRRPSPNPPRGGGGKTNLPRYEKKRICPRKKSFIRLRGNGFNLLGREIASRKRERKSAERETVPSFRAERKRRDLSTHKREKSRHCKETGEKGKKKGTSTCAVFYRGGMINVFCAKRIVLTIRGGRGMNGVKKKTRKMCFHTLSHIRAMYAGNAL